jgi:hypothetical protein
VKHWDVGEGALAWFILVLMKLLWEIRLGDGDLLPYLGYLSDKAKP